MKRFLILLFLLLGLFSFSQTKSFKVALNKAYDFEVDENFVKAKNIFKSMKDGNEINVSEKKFINNYIIFYDYLLSDRSDVKSIDNVIKNLLSIEKRKYYETELLINVITSKYHFLASNIGWKEALITAEVGYSLKDFKQAKQETQTDYLYDLGYLYDKVGNSFEGIKFYKKSLNLYIKKYGEVNNEVALNYNNLAYAYTNVYNQKNTIAYYEKAAKIWETLNKNSNDNKDYLVRVYHNLIFQYINYGDLEKAQLKLIKLNNYIKKKYQTDVSKSENTYFLSFSDYSLSNIRMSLALNKQKEALQFLKVFEENQFLPYKKTIHSKYLIQCYEEVADFLIEKKEYETAFNLIKKGLSLADKYDQKQYLVTLNSKIATIYKFQNKNDLAVKFYTVAQNNNNNTYFNSTKYTLEFLKSEIFFETNQTNKAVSIIKNNIEQLLFDYGQKKKTIDKLKFSDVRELVSTEFINLFYKSGKIYFQNYKKFKNKNDLQIADNLYNISNKLFREYYLKGEYNEELSKYHSEIIEGLLEISLEKKLTFQDKINLINEIEKSASQHLAQEFFKKITTNNNESNVNLEKIKELKNELNFYKNQSNSSGEKLNKNKIIEIENSIASLTKKTSRTYQDIDKNSLDNFDIVNVQKVVDKDELVIKYYTLKNYVFAIYISSNHIDIQKIATTHHLKKEVMLFLQQTKKVSQESFPVSKNLSVSLTKDLNAKKVTIIADGFLNYLPFEMLYDAANQKYLVQKSRVSYNYTLPFYLFNKQNNITVNNDKLIAFAPNYDIKTIATVRSGLSDLEHARKEADLISKLFNGTSYINEKASKANFFKTINQFGFYHFAMHSLVDENNINESCLVFSNNEKLYFSELYGLNFSSKMVVLSACDTGNGNLKSGEGIMSLSRALTYSGVQSSVFSLWQVPDKETSEIMISFYENLKDGQSKDEALANAKRDFIENNPMKNHPFYWAGFVVNGDVSPILEGTNWWLYIGIGLAMALLIFLFRKKLF
ncbi:CHAT domain-containing protein [Flavobacterium lacus]|uniref:CHAT domain-containing protein n=1 Tax=Flavobacterium lacus TaxID=1353778 RepID=A0A328X2M6_9FLAO|nr:CHAT domain-containing tetratricopeptide repeat protein [Flavobacterium lacus]RAR50454.1 CHAT domain-containing protein [Flavobacterium lacus]